MSRALDDVCERFLRLPVLQGRRVIAIWLFGSWARGDASAGSDLDLGVLCEPPLGIDRAAAMDEAAADLGMEVDIIDMATAPPVLSWEVVTSGRLLYEGDELEIERFLRRARYAAEDAERRDRMVLLAQVGSVGGRTR